jgi:DNA-binding GntR family transcriptional regulator
LTPPPGAPALVGQAARPTGSLTELAYNHIKEAILSLRLIPGQPLVEPQLAASLQISKTPVREALQRLASEGLVVLDRFRGATVRAVTYDWVDGLYEVRELLEPAAVFQVVPRLSADAIARMEADLKQSERALEDGDLVLLGASNRRFHGGFLDRVTNAFMRDVLVSIQNQLRVISVVTWMSIDSRLPEHEEHLAILEASRAGDAERARDLMSGHIRTFRLTALRALERRADGLAGLNHSA